MRKYYIFFSILTIVVIALLVGGFLIAGTPQSQRDKTFDQTRLAHFGQIENFINKPVSKFALLHV